MISGSLIMDGCLVALGLASVLRVNLVLLARFGFKGDSCKLARSLHRGDSHGAGSLGSYGWLRGNGSLSLEGRLIGEGSLWFQWVTDLYLARFRRSGVFAEMARSIFVGDSIAWARSYLRVDLLMRARFSHRGDFGYMARSSCVDSSNDEARSLALGWLFIHGSLTRRG